MKKLIRQIAFRNIKKNKGRFFCLVIAVFITIFFFVAIIWSGTILKASLTESQRITRSWDADAGFYIYDESIIHEIKKLSYVNEVCNSYILGHIFSAGNTVESEVAYCEDEFAKWMHFYPAEGRMPENGTEIVVSDSFLEKMGVGARLNQEITISYTIGEKNIVDTFDVVGIYKRSDSIREAIMVSEDYYKTKKEEYISQGYNAFPIISEVKYSSANKIEDQSQKLMQDLSFDSDYSEYVVNEYTESGYEKNINYVMILFFLLVIFLAYSFIHSTLSVSKRKDEMFFDKLSRLGIRRKELWDIFFIQISISYVIGILIGLPFGILISKYFVKSIFSRIAQVSVNSHPPLYLYIVATVVTYLVCLYTLWRFFGEIVKKKENKSLYDRYRKRHGKMIKNLLHRAMFRRIGANKRKLILVSSMIFVGTMIGNIFFSYLNGFDIEKYISSNLYYDYTIHSSTFTQSIENRVPIASEDIQELVEKEGIESSGGGAVTTMRIKLSDKASERYMESEVLGEQSDGIVEGFMKTYVYGLDKNLMEQAVVLDGNLDLEEFYSGNYIVVDSLGLDDTGSSCFHVGDEIKLTTAKGTVKAYKVMAIISLPYELSYKSKWGASSNLYLSMPEWGNVVGEEGYYIYTFNVEDAQKDSWDSTIENITSSKGNIVYESAKKIADDNKQLFVQLRMAVILLIIIIMFSSLVSFLNLILNETINLREETLNLQRIGVRKGSLVLCFWEENCIYVFSGIVLGLLISPFMTKAIILLLVAEEYVAYTYDITVSLIYVAIGIVLVGIISNYYKNNIITSKFGR